MNVAIRSATPSDLPAVRELLVETWHATYDGIYGAADVTAITNRWHSLENLEKQLAAAECAFLVAESGNSLAGTAYARSTADGLVELARLYVRPVRQGNGIGLRLLVACASAFPVASRMRLEVEPGNAPAIAFYRRRGFEVSAKTSACGGDVEAAKTALIMEASLPFRPLG